MTAWDVAGAVTWPIAAVTFMMAAKGHIPIIAVQPLERGLAAVSAFGFMFGSVFCIARLFGVPA